MGGSRLAEHLGNPPPPPASALPKPSPPEQLPPCGGAVELRRRTVARLRPHHRPHGGAGHGGPCHAPLLVSPHHSGRVAAGPGAH